MTSVPQQYTSAHKGHAVFRNQPSYQCFNKSFHDPTDALFLGLNEIHPHFLHDEQLERDTKVFGSQQLIDPRNRQPITQFYIDNTKQQPPKIFKAFQHRSKLSKEQHVVCLRVIQALKNQEEVLERDLLLYRHTEGKRRKEKLEFFKFIKEISQSKRERIYAPSNRLVMLYGDWYRSKAKLLLSLEENTSYNTHSGLPHVHTCGNSEQNVDVIDVQVLERKGFLSVWNRNKIDFKILSKSIETFSALREETDKKQEDHISVGSSLLQNVNADFNFNIPLDALLFLMTAGDYIDLPTEILLDIKNEDGNEKSVSFHTILPARNCGWHTNTQVVEQAFQAFQSLSPQTKWLHFDQDSKAFLLQPKEMEEIDAGLGSTERKFHPLPFNEYLQNLPTGFRDSKNNIKLCQALVQWKLRDTCSAEDIKICTVLPQPPAVDEDAKEFLGGLTIKLEYKPQYGCEVMTKYELLKEWLTLRLLASNRDDVVLERLRISASNLEILLIERLVRSQIEQELSEIYSVNITRLLSGLYEFLKMLQGIPSGEYMLRFNAKFRDKLMLCAPSQEITRNTNYIHSLLQAEPNDLGFMTQDNFLPIANDLCSAVHLYHKVLPCAFKPTFKARVEATKEGTRLASRFKYSNDRDFILSRVKEKSDISNSKKQFEKKRRNSQKARRKSRLRAAKRKEKQNEEEIKREIELDKMLFGLK